MARVLFHIDLNAFFTSSEELRHPEYEGKPLAVGSTSGRGVIATANYKAREYGVHSAMPTSQARALCDELIVIPGDHDYYRKLSSQFFAYLRQYSGMLEPLSIDECFLDVTDIIKNYPRPLDLAFEIQQGLYHTLKLRCSIGVGPTRFLAKMASDMRKPMGITVLRKSEIPAKLYPLPISDFYGIGKKTLPILEKEGFKTIGDLADPERQSDVARIFGNQYLNIRQKLNGTSSNRLSFSSTRKSISHSRTFETDLVTLDEVLNKSAELCKQITASMQKKHIQGKTISVTTRDGSFHNKVSSVTLPEYTNVYARIYGQVESLLIDKFEPVGYRLIGISIGSLENEEQIRIQPSIFDSQFRQDPTSRTISLLNDTLKGAGLMKASELLNNPKARKKKPAEEETEQETESDTGAAAAGQPESAGQQEESEMEQTHE